MTRDDREQDGPDTEEPSESERGVLLSIALGALLLIAPVLIWLYVTIFGSRNTP